jgi:hypothetical protein
MGTDPVYLKYCVLLEYYMMAEVSVTSKCNTPYLSYNATESNENLSEQHGNENLTAACVK